jgi:hypothetical protein
VAINFWSPIAASTASAVHEMSLATELAIMKAIYKHSSRAIIQFMCLIMWLIVLCSGIHDYITLFFFVIVGLILEGDYSMTLSISGYVASNGMAIYEKKKEKELGYKLS